MILFDLFVSFIQIGLFSFGGGYATLPLIQEQVVDLHGWLSMQEFSDLISISQMTPGPIAINSATFVGLQVGGVFGAIVATLGCILPSCIIVTTIAYFYRKYKKENGVKIIFEVLRPVVIALILSAGISIVVSALFGVEGIIAISTLRIDLCIIFIISCVLLYVRKNNPIFVMLIAGLLNFII